MFSLNCVRNNQVRFLIRTTTTTSDLQHHHFYSVRHRTKSNNTIIIKKSNQTERIQSNRCKLQQRYYNNDNYRKVVSHVQEDFYRGSAPSRPEGFLPVVLALASLVLLFVVSDDTNNMIINANTATNVVYLEGGENDLDDEKEYSDTSVSKDNNPQQSQDENEPQPVSSKPSPNQYYQPKVPYPEWDYNWDGKQAKYEEFLAKKTNQQSTTPVITTTRHILLIRHGQYDMNPSNDTERVLTPLGRHQAILTGQRLASLIRGITNINDPSTTDGNIPDDGTFPGSCTIKAIHVSTMTRAKETAELIVSQLPQAAMSIIEQTPPDPLLSEKLPYYIIPDRLDVQYPSSRNVEENHQQTEEAFCKYFYRALPIIATNTTTKNSKATVATSSEQSSSTIHQHEFEIIVCHANIIRYLVCRALQIPPEAWLRMSLFNCSVTYLMIQPNGYVTARLIGDTGHIPYEETTFSEMYGYTWHTML